MWNCSPDKTTMADSSASSDRWNTYKDYLKRKRDYKREWRKRKHEGVSIASSSKKTVGQRMLPPHPEKERYRPVAPTNKITSILNNPEQEYQIISGIGVEEHLEAVGQEELLEEEAMNDSNIVTLEDVGGDEETEAPTIYGFVEEEVEEELEEQPIQNTEEQTTKEETEALASEDEDTEFRNRWKKVYSRMRSVKDTEKRFRYLKIIEGIVQELW